MVQGIDSGHWIADRLIERIEHDLALVEAAPLDDAARSRVQTLMSALDQVVASMDYMAHALNRRVTERDRLRACRASHAELARHERTETIVWSQLVPVRADLASALLSGADLGTALGYVLPNVDRIARRHLVESRQRLQRMIRQVARCAPRARARSRASRRRRCTASRARPSSNGDSEPPAQRARGPPLRGLAIPLSSRAPTTPDPAEVTLRGIWGEALGATHM